MQLHKQPIRTAQELQSGAHPECASGVHPELALPAVVPPEVHAELHACMSTTTAVDARRHKESLLWYRVLPVGQTRRELHQPERVPVNLTNDAHLCSTPRWSGRPSSWWRCFCGTPGCRTLQCHTALCRPPLSALCPCRGWRRKCPIDRKLTRLISGRCPHIWVHAASLYQQWHQGMADTAAHWNAMGTHHESFARHEVVELHSHRLAANSIDLCNVQCAG